MSGGDSLAGAGIRALSGELNPAQYGWKAHHLARLVDAGFAVPPGAVISAHRAEIINPGVVKELVRASPATFADRTGPWRLAVRSSSAAEDTATGSQAGSFLSITATLDEFSLCDAIAKVARSDRAGQPMGVIVQALVDPEFAGVSFSIDPVSFRRDVVAITSVRGLAGDLVAGHADGETIVVPRDLESRPASQLPGELIRAVVEQTSAVEIGLGLPVDCEWCFAADTGFWLVQARPIVLPAALDQPLETSDSFRSIDTRMLRHPKLVIRRAAFDAAVPMARAVLHIRRFGDGPRVVQHDSYDDASVGTSVVLLYPERVDGVVNREFTGTGAVDMELLVASCQRYSIRRYPARVGIDDTIVEVAERGLNGSAVVAVLDAQVLGCDGTGVFRQVGDQIVIEVARGHFVPKGMVVTSRYLATAEGEVVGREEHDQPMALHFVDGHVVREEPVADQIRLDDQQVAHIVAVLRPLADLGTLEFGFFLRDDGIDVFLIDATDLDIGVAELSSDLISSGVLSPGRFHGTLEVLPTLAGGSLDHHLYDRVDGAAEVTAGKAYLADRDGLELLSLVRLLGPDNAMVFRTASLLSHLSVVLRERGVTAIVAPGPDGLVSGNRIAIDAADPGIGADQRLRVVVDDGLNTRSR